MIFTYTNKNEVTARPDTGENIPEFVDAAIGKAASDPVVWNLFIELTPGDWNANRQLLDDWKFQPAGTLSIDNKTLLKLRLAIRRAGGGAAESFHDIDLAASATTPAKSPIETSAIAELLSRPEYAGFRDRF